MPFTLYIYTSALLLKYSLSKGIFTFTLTTLVLVAL